MTDAIDIVRAGFLTDLERLRVISQNLANTSSAGYKAQSLNTPAFEQVLEAVSVHGQDLRLPRGEDRRAGALQFTGDRHDFAITGDGFFEIQTSEGSRYTRRGDFHVDDTGRLVTQAGDEVVGEAGAISLQSSEFSVDASGVVWEGDRRAGKLAVVTPDTETEMTYQGEGLYQPTSGSAAGPSSNYSVQQGYLEASNVDITREMVSLVEVTRSFSLVQRALQGYDEMLDAAVNRMGQG